MKARLYVLPVVASIGGGTIRDPLGYMIVVDTQENQTLALDVCDSIMKAELNPMFLPKDSDGEIDIPNEMVETALVYLRARETFERQTTQLEQLIKGLPANIREPKRLHTFLEDFERPWDPNSIPPLRRSQGSRPEHLRHSQKRSAWQRFKNWCSRRFSIE